MTEHVKQDLARKCNPLYLTVKLLTCGAPFGDLCIELSLVAGLICLLHGQLGSAGHHDIQLGNDVCGMDRVSTG